MRMSVRASLPFRRGAALLLAALPLGLVIPAPAAAGATLPAPPTVTMALDGQRVDMPDALRSSRYRFVLDGVGGVQLLKVARGYTRAEFLRDVNLEAGGSVRASERLERNIRFFGGVFARHGERGVFWETLYSGTYWVISTRADLEQRSDIKVVTVSGAVRATAWPGSTATLTMAEDGVEAPAQLPRRGRLLVRNAGKMPDLFAVLRLAPGKTIEDLENWDPESDEEPIEDVAVPVALLSGDTSMLWGYAMPRGSYVIMNMGSLWSDADSLRDVVAEIRVR
ncbi:MAG: hypothetical protein M3Q27_14260 [Actinomycetota bacterium]|nr:hypothetical protein [Actinomycetota bacterium]